MTPAAELALSAFEVGGMRRKEHMSKMGELEEDPLDMYGYLDTEGLSSVAARIQKLHQEDHQEEGAGPSIVAALEAAAASADPGSFAAEADVISVPS